MKTITQKYGENNELNLKLIVGLARVNLHHERATTRLLSRYGLTLPQFGVLETLYHKGDMRVCELIEKTLSTSGNMTVIIKNLECEGYIERYNDPQDKRAYRIIISAKGEALIDSIFPVHLKEIEAWTNVLTKEERESLVNLLKKLGRR